MLDLDFLLACDLYSPRWTIKVLIYMKPFQLEIFIQSLLLESLLGIFFFNIILKLCHALKVKTRFLVPFANGNNQLILAY